MMTRLATEEDLPQIASIYEEILSQEEATQSYTNWIRGVYPTIETARNALQQGWLYVIEQEGAICATAILNHVQLPEYQEIDWAYPGEGEQIFVIHTLCVPPSRSGQGLAALSLPLPRIWRPKRDVPRCALILTREIFPLPAYIQSWVGAMREGAYFLFQGVIPEVLKCFEKQIISP